MAGMISKTGPDFWAVRPKRRFGWLIGLLQAVIIVAMVGWLALAFEFRLVGPLRIVLQVLIAAVFVVLVALWWMRRTRVVWVGIAALIAGTALWWSTIHPTNTADWLPPVAHGVTAEVNGNDVTLHNVRNFDWTSLDDYTPRWEDRSYKLDQLNEVDLFTSVWGNPNIAHIMVGFGFTDGQHVVFSVETRMYQGQQYSTLGGFFRVFNLVLIAADERDIIRLRTDIRNPSEQVSLYPLTKVSDKQRQAAFLDFLEMGNRLDRQPEFYNTLTTNCTTVPWQLARSVGAVIPLNWKVLASENNFRHRFV